MMGKFLVSLIIGASLFMGAAIYYLQVYAYYEELDPDTVDLRLISVVSGQPEPFLIDDVQAIDANSSPLRFRACFTTPLSQATLTETFAIYDEAEPLIAPGWFDCFDAVEVGEALEAGQAIAYLARADIRDGVDRVIAVFGDGRAFAWHQLNDKYKD